MFNLSSKLAKTERLNCPVLRKAQRGSLIASLTSKAHEVRKARNATVQLSESLREAIDNQVTLEKELGELQDKLIRFDTDQ